MVWAGRVPEQWAAGGGAVARLSNDAGTGSHRHRIARIHAGQEGVC